MACDLNRGAGCPPPPPPTILKDLYPNKKFKGAEQQPSPQKIFKSLLVWFKAWAALTKRINSIVYFRVWVWGASAMRCSFCGIFSNKRNKNPPIDCSQRKKKHLLLFWGWQLKAPHTHNKLPQKVRPTLLIENEKKLDNLPGKKRITVREN